MTWPCAHSGILAVPLRWVGRVEKVSMFPPHTQHTGAQPCTAVRAVTRGQCTHTCIMWMPLPKWSGEVVRFLCHPHKGELEQGGDPRLALHRCAACQAWGNVRACPEAPEVIFRVAEEGPTSPSDKCCMHVQSHRMTLRVSHSA